MQHPVLVRVLLVFGTILPLIFPFGIFLSRRRHFAWIRIVAILVGVAGLAWGTLDALLLFRHFSHDVFLWVVHYRDIMGYIAVTGGVAIALEHYHWKNRTGDNPPTELA
jgi:hypothetical protein